MSLTMLLSPFLMASALAAIVLGLLTAGFEIWYRSRFGETEKRYVIQGMPILACVGIFAYLALHHHVFWSLNLYNVVYFSASWLIRSNFRRKTQSSTKRN